MATDHTLNRLPSAPMHLGHAAKNLLFSPYAKNLSFSVTRLNTVKAVITAVIIPCVAYTQLTLT